MSSAVASSPSPSSSAATAPLPSTPAAAVSTASSSSSHGDAVDASSYRPATLFTAAIQCIYAYLSLRDMNAVMQANKHWYAAAASELLPSKLAVAGYACS